MTARLTAFYTDVFVLPLPDGHRFPMDKYSRLRERIAAEDIARLEVPPGAVDEELALAHEGDWIRRVVQGELTPREVRQLGFPWSDGLVERSRRSVGASIAAARTALDEGFGVNLAGGTHHGFRGHGEGFCVFNDVAVAARVLQREHGVHRVLVVDLDVHQGNGTAAIFRDDPSVFTLSIHGRGNYPFRKERSDIDVALADGSEDDAYMDALTDALDRALGRFAPDFVFYLAGADPFVEDTLGKLSLSVEGLGARDRIVLDRVEELGVPCALSMAGGYARDIDDIVRIHLQTVRETAHRRASYPDISR